MKITQAQLRRLIREEAADVQELQKLVDDARDAVEFDMKQRPTSSRDGIWRFDSVIEAILGKGSEHDKQTWLEIERIARRMNADGSRRSGWTGYSVVASYAQTKAAYATPGFTAARRDYMS